MKPVKTFRVIPKLPEKIERLRDLAQNLFWCWDYEAVSLFRRMDHDLWEDLDHKPVRMLGTIDPRQLDEFAQDDGFLAHYHRVLEKFERYMLEQKWYEKKFGKKEVCMAYFSAEFGITESLPIYSGGLGILASFVALTKNARESPSFSGCSRAQLVAPESDGAIAPRWRCATRPPWT